VKGLVKSLQEVLGDKFTPDSPLTIDCVVLPFYNCLVADFGETAEDVLGTAEVGGAFAKKDVKEALRLSAPFDLMYVQPRASAEEG
jgi:hypothetical protein